MLRVVLVAVLATAVLGASLPAVEGARGDRTGQPERRDLRDRERRRDASTARRPRPGPVVFRGRGERTVSLSLRATVRNDAPTLVVARGGRT